MKTRLATLIFAISAAILHAQEAAPAASPAPTPSAEGRSADIQPAAESTAAVTGTATEAAAATPAPDATFSTGGMTLSGTGAPAQSPDNALFSEPSPGAEPDLESTAPDRNFIDVPPSSGPDRMPPGGPTFRKTKTSESVEEVKQRIRVRQAKTRALQDPNVLEALERADAAQTVPERREAMRDYYNALYDRMVRIDSSVKKSVDELRRQSLKRLDDSAYGLAKKSKGFRR